MLIHLYVRKTPYEINCSLENRRASIRRRRMSINECNDVRQTVLHVSGCGLQPEMLHHRQWREQDAQTKL